MTGSRPTPHLHVTKAQEHLFLLRGVGTGTSALVAWCWHRNICSCCVVLAQEHLFLLRGVGTGTSVLVTWCWRWLFPRLRGFGRNVPPFISRLRIYLFILFFIFLKWRLARAHQFHSFCQDQSTVAQRAETTVAECSLTSCV